MDSERVVIDELELLRQRDEISRDQRVRRYLEVQRQGIIPDHYFAQASTQCLELYRDGYFTATVMMTQAVNEGILKLVAERNGLSAAKRECLLDLKTSLLLQHLPLDCLEASAKIWRSFRNDIHHMNPRVSELDFQKLAKDNIQRLAVVEGTVFGCSFQEGRIEPRYPRYWDLGEDGTVPVILRHPRT